MANHSLKDAENQAETSKKIIKGAAIGTLAWLVGKAIIDDQQEKLRQRAVELEKDINCLNKQIADYERNWLKSAWYADEISALKNKRAECQAELSKIRKQLA